MSDAERDNERLRDAFAAADLRTAPSGKCPGDSEIWSASRGDLPPQRIQELLAHSQDCPACAESFSVAAGIGKETSESAPASERSGAVVRPFSIPRKWMIIPITAVAASILLMVLVPILFKQDAPAPMPVPVTTLANSTETTFWRAGTDADVPLAHGERIRPGDSLYLTFKSDVAAHVYVINSDLEGEPSVLFPIEGSQWKNPLPAGTEVRLPGSRSWEYDSWEVSSAGGRDSFIVLASARPLPEIEAALALLEQASPDGGEFMRGETPERSDTGGAAALKAALTNLQVVAGERTDIIIREIVLENPK